MNKKFDIYLYVNGYKVEGCAFRDEYNKIQCDLVIFEEDKEFNIMPFRKYTYKIKKCNE